MGSRRRAGGQLPLNPRPDRRRSAGYSVVLARRKRGAAGAARTTIVLDGSALSDPIEAYMRGAEDAGKLLWVSSSVGNLLPIAIAEGDLLDEILTELGSDFELVTVTDGAPDAAQWATAVEGLGGGQEPAQEPRGRGESEPANTAKVTVTTPAKPLSDVDDFGPPAGTEKPRKRFESDFDFDFDFD